MTALRRSLLSLWRPLLFHWRRTLPLFLLLTLAAALLAALPLLADRVAGTALRQALAALPVPARGITLQAPALPPRWEEEAVDALDPLLSHVFVANEQVVTARAGITRAGELLLFDPTQQDVVQLALHGVGDLAAGVELVTGRLPLDDPAAGAVEAAIGPGTAAWLGLAPGDLLTPETGPPLRIVGVVEPRDPADPRWWGDAQLLPFTIWRRVSFNPDLVEVTAGLFVPPQAVVARYGGTAGARLLLDGDRLTAAGAAAAGDQVRRYVAAAGSQGVTATTQLDRVLLAFDAQRRAGTTALLLLSSQALLAVLLVVNALGRLLVAAEERQLLTLVGRGYGSGRLALMLAARLLLPALAAWPLGVGVATLLVYRPVKPALTDPVLQQAFWLAGAGLLLAWLAAAAPVPAALREGHLLQRRLREPQRRAAGWGVLPDLGLLLLGGAGYWQLRLAGGAPEALNDPLLLLSPTLLLLGAALLLRRFLPPFWRAAARLTAPTRAALPHLALLWLGRERALATRLLFLTIMSVALLIFARVFTVSLAVGETAAARERAGAQLRVAVDPDRFAAIAAGLDGDAAVDGATLLRGRVREEAGVAPTLLALTGADAARLPTLSGAGLDQFIAGLEAGEPGVVPVLISRSYPVPGRRLGDRMELRLGGTAIMAEVQGIAASFPTLTPPFIVAEQAALEAVLDARQAYTANDLQGEVWLTFDGAVTRALPFLPEAADPRLVLADEAALRDRYRFHPVARQVGAALDFNLFVLVGLTALGLMLFQFLALRERRGALALLAIQGVGHGALRGVLLLEALLVLGVGGLLGGLLGWLLTRAMTPLLALTLAAAAGWPDAPLVWDRGTLAPLLGGVLALFGAAAALPLLTLRRTHLHAWLRAAPDEA